MMAVCSKLPDRFAQYGPSWLCSHSFFTGVMARIAYQAGGATFSELTPTPANMPHLPVIQFN